MRRLFAWLLTVAFLVPIATACVPGGYEGENPARPPGNEVPVDEPEGNGAAEPPAEEPSGEETG